MPLSPLRPFPNAFAMAPTATEVKTMNEPPSTGFLWEQLRQYSEIQERGRSLFVGKLGQRNTLWIEFRNYVRQAKAYFDGAEHVQGSSAALLYYYSFLNLAKAELLRSVSSQIVGVEVHHGLTYRPADARTIRGDVVRVRSGVFSLLYRARTGHTAPSAAPLRIPRVLGSIPGIGWELTQTAIARPRCARICSIVAVDQTQMWSFLALDESLPGSHAAFRKLLNAHYEQTNRPLRELIRLGTFSLAPWTFWQSRWTIPRVHLSAPSADEGLEVCRRAWAELSPSIDASHIPGIDALLTTGLSSTTVAPMPSTLASYVAIFYLSSLVRYKPQQLDPQRFASQAWLMDCLARETSLPLLARAVSCITDTTVAFSPTTGVIRI
jgi:hypothetical protein